MAERYPVYAEADLTVESRDCSHEAMGGPDGGRHRGAPGPMTTADDSSPADVGLTRVPVGLGDRSYDILIGPGLLAQAGARIAALAPGSACVVVTDANLAGRHLPALQASLDAAGLRHAAVVVAPGEGSKSFAAYAEVCGAVLDARAERGDIVVALGGGVVGEPRGLRGRHAEARHALRAGPDEPPRPGGFVGGRQDRDQRPPGQEPRRRLPPAEPRAGRHGRASTR